MNVIVKQILSNFELNDFNYLIDCIWLIVCDAIKHIKLMNKNYISSYIKKVIIQCNKKL